MPNHDATYPRTNYKGKPKSSSGRTFGSIRYSLRLDETSYVTWTRLAWLLLLYYNESHVWRSAVKSCRRRMPVRKPSAAAKTGDGKDGAGGDEETKRVALIGDPQLVDENTYARRGLAMKLTQFYTDFYMRRNYRHLRRILAPDLVVFTGDLFDGGREWGDDKWEAELKRYRTVFPADEIAIDSLPGNHDIGMADGVRPEILARFAAHFGSPSRVVRAGAWDIVLLDTVSLSSTDKAVAAEARKFLESLVRSTSFLSTSRSAKRPRMLVTHVPLYRPPDGPCGPLRESTQPILIQQGHQYQNVLVPSLSDEIWDKVKPDVVFAGDDHDYCDYRHEDRSRGVPPPASTSSSPGHDKSKTGASQAGSKGVREINVKSFSWAMGIQHPGFQVVDLSPDGHYDTQLCRLPGQLPIFASYAIALLLTATGAVLVRRKGRKARANRKAHESPARYAIRLAWLPLLTYAWLLWYTAL